MEEEGKKHGTIGRGKWRKVNVSLEKIKLSIKRISNCSTKIYSH